MKTNDKLIMHATPVLDSDGDTVRMAYFPTITECKAFAVEQMHKLGRHYWSMDSIPAHEVARLLGEHAPIPEHRQ